MPGSLANQHLGVFFDNRCYDAFHGLDIATVWRGGAGSIGRFRYLLLSSICFTVYSDSAVSPTGMARTFECSYCAPNYLWRERDWQALWNLITESFRAFCPRLRRNTEQDPDRRFQMPRRSDCRCPVGRRLVLSRTRGRRSPIWFPVSMPGNRDLC